MSQDADQPRDGIRRRPGIAAAVLVVVVVGAVAAFLAWPREEPGPPQATATEVRSSSSTTTTSSTPTPEETPQTPYALDDTVHLGALSVTVPDGRVLGLAVLAGDRFLVETAPEGEVGSGRWSVLAADGAVVADLGTTGGAVASPDGTMIVVKDDPPTGPVRVLDTDGHPVARRDVGSARPGAVVGGRVLLTADSGSELWDVATDAVTPLPVGSRGLSADGRYAMGTSGYDDPTEQGCWFLVDLTRSPPATSLERCGDENPEPFVPGELSPDGRWLLGESLTDGGFFFRLAVVDAQTGEVVLGRTTAGEAVDGWSWAFDAEGDTILFSRNPSAPPFPALQNDLVRCTLDMDCGQVGPAVALDDHGTGFTLPRYVVGRPLRPAPTG